MFEVLPGRFNEICLWGHTSTIKIAYIMTKLYSFLLFWLVFFFFEFSGFSDPRYLGVAAADSPPVPWVSSSSVPIPKVLLDRGTPNFTPSTV